MKTTSELSDKRQRDHDYSMPGTYHLLLETAKGAGKLGTMRKGVMVLNAFGEAFLTVLAMALHHFPCLRIDGMDVRPHAVELAVTVTCHRKWFRVVFEKLKNWWHFRRTMTIPLFVGFLKQNSARRINGLKCTGGGSFWTVRYKARVLTEQSEIDAVCARLNARFQRVRYAERHEPEVERKYSLNAKLSTAFASIDCDGPKIIPRIGITEHRYGTMLLGRLLLLNGSMLSPRRGMHVARVGEADSDTARAQCRWIPPIRSVGPGRIFLSRSQE